MKLSELQENWDKFGKTDAMWSILTVEGTENNQWDEERFFKTGRKFVQRILKHFELVGIAVEKGSALDFGCGIGRVTQGLAIHFDQVSGVDIAPSMIEQAKEKNQFPDKCKYYLNERADLSLFADGTFDLVLSIIVLQHMQPQYAMQYIREFQRILKPGGLMYFQIPSDPPEEYRRYMKRKRMGGRIYTWLSQLLEGRRHEPVMEMYWISKDDMTQHIEASGLITEFIQANDWAGNEWKSYTYCLRKGER